MTEHRYPNASIALPYLADHIMGAGEEVGSRGGDRVIESLHQHIVLEQPWQREVLTPGRRAHLPAQIAETMWVLAGRNDLEFLGHYLPRAYDFSDDGETWRAGYGPRLRNWSRGNEDQLANVIRLLQADPLTRRAVISLWDPEVDTLASKDIPCNNWLSFSSRKGKLDLHVAIRSNDLIWGWSGINQFEWSALQEVVAGILGIQVGELHFTTTSLHIYDRHWKKATQLAELTNDLFDTPEVPEPGNDSPRFQGPNSIRGFDALAGEWFKMEHLIRNQSITSAGLGYQIQNFPEPMLRSWLSVLAWWWSKDETFLLQIEGTRLALAARQTPRASVVPTPEPEVAVELPSIPEGESFAEFAANLHAEKSKAYGDSWKRRGEMLGIMANIARKVDRLGVSGGGDTAADTAIDLLIYLIKYRLWLEEAADHPGIGENVRVAGLLRHYSEVKRDAALMTDGSRIEAIRELFDDLEKAVKDERGHAKETIVKQLINLTAPMAENLWEAERA